jgi:hypothetical protein
MTLDAGYFQELITTTDSVCSPPLGHLETPPPRLGQLEMAAHSLGSENEHAAQASVAKRSCYLTRVQGLALQPGNSDTSLQRNIGA